jgi:Mn2+/Fe2+ NRAMP family transporter
MSSLTVSIIGFACVLGSALLGMLVRRFLPDDHLSTESKDVVRLGMGLVATTLALVLGLLVASAKGFYDTQSTEVTQAAADIVLLDRLLAHYGPETADARAALRSSVAGTIERTWPRHGSDRPCFQPGAPKGEVMIDKIQELSPRDDNQRSLRTQALGLAIQLGQTRWLVFTQQTVSVPMPLLVILLFWLSVLFISFGLFAPPNLTVLTSLFISAVAVCAAIFLILEMYHPYTGLIRLSDAPLRSALAQLGQ